MTLPEVAAAHKNGAGSGANTTTPDTDPVPMRAPSTKIAAVTDGDGVNPLEFEGSVDTSDEPPTLETIRKIDNYTVLDKDGKSHTFRSLYTGRHRARRVLIIFIRHFFCGNCQQYLQAVSESITPQALLSRPRGGTTFICVVGCGDPALIDMYAEATGCPYPIYADPTRRLYAELGMIRTLALGPRRPAYMRTGLLKSSLLSVAQGLKQVLKGLALKGGDTKQVGGEFLFEPVAAAGPDGVRAAETAETPVGIEPPAAWAQAGNGEGAGQRSETSLDGKGEPDSDGVDKVVTWCHRMRNTRDHAEIPVLMEVLGLKDEPAAGGGGDNKERDGKSGT